MNIISSEQLIKDAEDLKIKALALIAKTPPPIVIKISEYEWHVRAWK